MKTILFVTGALSLVSKVQRYVEQGSLSGHRIFYAVEFFEKEIPNDLPANVLGIKDLLDQEELSACCLSLKSLGDFDAVVALEEFSIYAAADIRSHLGCRGPKKSELKKFRDKVAMKEALLGSGISVPRVYTREELLDGQVSFPLIAKPRAFCGSIGVRKIHDQNELNEVLNLESGASKSQYDQQYPELRKEDLQFETYITGDIFHIDGLVVDGQIRFVHASKYINTCLDFISGQPIGTCSVSDVDEQQAWAKFAETTVKVMGVPDGAFHLEAFKTPQGEKVFLEIAVRPPGGFIVETLEALYGFDLRLAHIQAQIGGSILLDEDKQGLRCGGHLIFPMSYIAEGESPRKFVSGFEQLNKADYPTLRQSRYPQIGTAAENEFAYEHNLGAFIFGPEDANPSVKPSNQVELDIRRVMENYKVRISG